MKSYHDKEKGIGILFDDIYLAGGSRTPFGKFCGTLGRVSPTDLGIFATKGALEKTGIDAKSIDQVIVANIGQACPDAYFLPRHIALFSGVPMAVPTLMVQRICASGLKLSMASEQQHWAKQKGLCCGTENMSRSYGYFGNRMGHPSEGRTYDMLRLFDDTACYLMGETAENLQKYNIREKVDEFAQTSSERHRAKSRCFSGDHALNSAVFEVDGFAKKSESKGVKILHR
jgi:acetyl-CoA C-acetyltransferase